MSIYEFLETLNDNYNTVFTLFDCNSSDLVSVDTDEEEGVTELSREDLLESVYSDCEIGSMDMWIDKEQDRIHIEFNIEVEEEDEDDDEI